MSTPITVKQVIDLYLKNLAARVAADDFWADGAKAVGADLEGFAAKYGNQTIRQCKQHDLTAWLADNPQWKAVATKRRVVSSVTACFNWALDEELIDRSPYRRPRSLRGKPSNIRRPASQNEYVQLMRNGDRTLRRALYILRKTGMRTCEMRGLTWDEVYLDGEIPHLSIVRHKTFRQTGKPRNIGLDRATARFLRNLKRQYERRCACHCATCKEYRDPHVFTNSLGRPWTKTAFATKLRRLAKFIGLDEGVEKRVSAYCVRHFFCVNAIESGVATRSIADQLGHATTRVIDSVYGSHTRQRIEHLSNVADEINRKRNKQEPTKGTPDA